MKTQITSRPEASPHFVRIRQTSDDCVLLLSSLYYRPKRLVVNYSFGTTTFFIDPLALLAPRLEELDLSLPFAFYIKERIHIDISSFDSLSALTKMTTFGFAYQYPTPFVVADVIRRLPPSIHTLRVERYSGNSGGDGSMVERELASVAKDRYRAISIGLPSLTSLQLGDGEHPPDFCDLVSCGGLDARLTTLLLDGRDYSTLDITGLATYHNLTCLSICECTSITGLDQLPVASLSALKIRDYKKNSVLTLAPVLARLTNLTTLSVYQVNSLTVKETLPSLASNKKKHQLDLHGLTTALATTLRTLVVSHSFLKDVSALSRLTALVHLDVSHNADIVEFEFLIPLVRLEKLEMQFTSDLYTLDHLAGLTRLTSLTFGPRRREHRVFLSLHPLRALVNLESLSCENAGIGDLKPLENCRKLHHLQMGRNPSLRLSTLPHFPLLHTLDICACQSQILAPLSTLTSLTSLNICKNQVVDITPLCSLHRLEELYMWSNKITDVAPLASLSALHTLFVQCNPLATLEPLALFSRLNYLTIGPTHSLSLLPLLSVPRLRRLRTEAPSDVDSISSRASFHIF